MTELLDELERLLVELAASPDQLSAEDVERVQQRVAAKDLLFKVRVVSTALRARQQQTQTRGLQEPRHGRHGFYGIHGRRTYTDSREKPR